MYYSSVIYTLRFHLLYGELLGHIEKSQIRQMSFICFVAREASHNKGAAEALRLIIEITNQTANSRTKPNRPRNYTEAIFDNTNK
jgi:hypothetical protein